MGFILSLMKTLSTNSLTCLLNSACSVEFIQKCGKFGRLDPGISVGCHASVVIYSKDLQKRHH